MGIGPTASSMPLPQPTHHTGYPTHELLVKDELLERPLDEDVVGPEDALSAL